MGYSVCDQHKTQIQSQNSKVGFVLLEVVPVFLVEHIHPGGHLSLTQLLTHSPPVGWGRQQKITLGLS